MSNYKGVLVMTTILFSVLLKANAQENKWRAFQQLSRPEKSWVILHPFIATKSWKITERVKEVSADMKTDTILDGDMAGGQLDAFRHTFWMASLSQKISWRKALRLGEAHEKGNYLSFKKRRMNEEILPDSISSEMDLFNNRLGVDFGRNHREASEEKLRHLVIDAILNGHAKILWKNSSGDFLDCAGNIILMEDFKFQWGIPKCLVSSDK